MTTFLKSSTTFGKIKDKDCVKIGSTLNLINFFIVLDTFIPLRLFLYYFQLDNIESKFEHSTKIHGKDHVEEHKGSLGHFDTVSLDPSTTARQNYILRQQKEHLQRLIERLTNIKPSHNPTLTQHVTNPIKVGSYNLRGSDYASRLKDY